MRSANELEVECGEINGARSDSKKWSREIIDPAICNSLAIMTQSTPHPEHYPHSSSSLEAVTIIIARTTRMI